MKKFVTFIIGIVMILLGIANFAFSAPIPDTGQNQSNTDSCIACEDSDFIINPKDYTKLDKNGNELSASAPTWAMVRDNVTGLIWEIKQSDDSIQDKTKQLFWHDPEHSHPGTATENMNTNDLINALNNNNYGGFSDWRLPTIHELASLIDMNDDGIQTQFFPDVMNGDYWTSDSYAVNLEKAWTISFITSKNNYNAKSEKNYVRAVRKDENTTGLKRFVNNNDDTITDITTGLMWIQQDIDERTWEYALNQVNTLYVADYYDWRMPTREELRSIVDYTKSTSVVSDDFSDMTNANYWTSTAYQDNHVWCIDFDNGNDNYQPSGNTYRSMAVRGGQDRTVSGKIVISSPAQGSVWENELPMSIVWDPADVSGDVEIAIKRDRGEFAVIAAQTENDGSYTWEKVTGNPSFNCILKIVPKGDPDKASELSFFTIKSNAMPVMNVNPSSGVEIPFLAGELDISIFNSGTDTMNWEIKTKDTWIHFKDNLTRISGTDNQTITLVYEGNNTAEQRTGQLIINAPGAINGELTYEVIQKAGKPIIHVSPSEMTIGAFDDTAIFTVTNQGTVDLTWEATETYSWLEIIGSNTDINTGQINLRVQQNFADSRTAIINISAPNATNSPVSVTLTQTAGYPVLKVLPNSQEASAAAGNVEFIVSNAGSRQLVWNAKAKNDWLIIQYGQSGVNEGTINVTVQANDSSARTGVIEVTSDDGQVVNLYINQRAGNPILTLSQQIFNVGGYEGIRSFTIENTGSGILTWSVASNADWLTILTQTSGTQQSDQPPSTVRVQYGKNLGDSRDDGLLTVTSNATAQTQTFIRFYQDSLIIETPDGWEVNPRKFQYQCMLVGVVYNSQTESMEHENDLLAAFVNDECRGVASPQVNPDDTQPKLYFLQIWSNTINEVISFRFFDSNTNTTFNKEIESVIIFKNNKSFGSILNPHDIFISKIEADLPLQRGWNWVSLTVRADDMGLNSLLSSINDQCEKVVSQNGFAEYYSNQWYGTIDVIDPSQMYLFKMFNEKNLTYFGVYEYNSEPQIQLYEGWNWISYLPYDEREINKALNSLGNSAERIVGSQGFSEYSDRLHGWYGSLETLKPSEGYQVKVKQNVALDYALSRKRTTPQDLPFSHSKRPFAAYQDFACLTVKVKNVKTAPNDRLIAHSTTGEIRGEATPTQTPNENLFFMQVWLNSSNEQIHFTYEPSGSKSKKIKETLSLNAFDTRGDIESPLTLTTNQSKLEELIKILQILAGGQ